MRGCRAGLHPVRGLNMSLCSVPQTLWPVWTLRNASVNVVELMPRGRWVPGDDPIPLGLLHPGAAARVWMLGGTPGMVWEGLWSWNPTDGVGGSVIREPRDGVGGSVFREPQAGMVWEALCMAQPVQPLRGSLQQ